MSKRISKAVREEAALMCQLAASNPWIVEDDESVSGLNCFVWTVEAYHLAVDAWEAARANEYGPVHLGGLDAPWAEAEAMLRTGWVP